MEGRGFILAILAKQVYPTSLRGGILEYSVRMEYTATGSRERQGVEEGDCEIYSGAPTVSQTTGYIR